MIRSAVSFLIMASTLGLSAFALPTPYCAQVFRKQAKHASYFSTTAGAASAAGLSAIGFLARADFAASTFPPPPPFLKVASRAGLVFGSVSAMPITSLQFKTHEHFLRLLARARDEMEISDSGFHIFLLTTYLNSILEGRQPFSSPETGKMPEVTVHASLNLANHRFDVSEVTKLIMDLEHAGKLCPRNVFGIRARELIVRMAWARATQN